MFNSKEIFYMIIAIVTVCIAYLQFLKPEIPIVVQAPPIVNKFTVPNITPSTGHDNTTINSPIKQNAISEQGRMKSETFDFSSFVNTPVTTNHEIIDISVTIIDDQSNILTDVSSQIASLYKERGKKTNTGLLRSTFVRRKEFAELFQGNYDIIDRLKLQQHTKYVALGKISYATSPGQEVAGSVVCKASIIMSIICTDTKSIAQSFTITTKGNGVNEAQASDDALNKIFNKYYSEHSTF